MSSTRQNGVGSPAELLDGLAAAVVGADPEDASTLEDVVRALEAACAAGVGGPLAEEADELAADLGRPGATAEALRRLSELLSEADGGSTVPEMPLSGAASASRDAETIELISDFLEEGTEGLARADEILLAVERSGADADRTNALFRVFHTIKGVAGFLELGPMVSLAHIAETLLNQVREGRRPLDGGAFEVIFEATATLRRMLEALRAAVDAGAALPPTPGADALVGRIQAEVGKVPSEDEPDLAASPAGPAPVVLTPVLPTPVARAPEPAFAAGGRVTSTPVAVTPVAAAPATFAAVPAPASGPALRETVKVDLERVDSLVEMIGELIIVESMVIDAPELQGLGSLKLRNDLNQLSKISRDLQGVGMRMRMVPVRGAFQKMARLVRDLGRKTGKDIVLELSGEDTEMDRSMVERMEDPLVHLVRNASDHGIETVADRVASGKPARGTLRLSARHEGASVVIELKDDGRGMQREKILAKAREKGLLAGGDEFSDQDVWNLIFLPGFSTAANVTEISGRGVGMDVVKRNVEGMRGRVSVHSRAGEGTTFRMVLPLTLAIIDGMLISAGKERYILPSLAIVEALRPTEEMVRVMAGRGELVNVRGEILPLLRLHRLLEMDGPAPDVTACHVVVVEGLGRKLGLLVDDVLSQQQVVIKPLGQGVAGSDFLSGAAILSDGRVGLILNVDKLASLASRPGGESGREAGARATGS